MKKIKSAIVPLLLFAVFLTCVPSFADAASELTASDAAIELIKRYESFSPKPYEENGRWYVGYGVQIPKGEYAGGITEQEATELLRERLSGAEKALNRFFDENALEPTQGQFDALVDFTYTTGDAWLRGSSALRKLAAGTCEASRRETARAFAVWSHVGGKVLPGLAERRLEEAALYLDGNSDGKDEFVYLAVSRQENVVCSTDIAVYERGGEYDAFPKMFRLGYRQTGVRTALGELIQIGDTAGKNSSGVPVWQKREYAFSFDDVAADAWYYDSVMELCESGLIGGRGDGRFEPDAPVTVGEALQFVLLACGRDGQPSAGLSAPFFSRLLDEPDRPATRLETARLAALALGFGQSFSASAFDDTDDGYVTALSEAGVVKAAEEDGETLFYPKRQISRAEICDICWRLRCAAALGTVQTVRYGAREFEVASGVALNHFDKDSFSGRGKEMAYEEPGVDVLRGVDVSRFQESIDWASVKEEGIDFAMLRVGGRYWGSGGIYEDRFFEEYYTGADAAGMMIGCYFFSQAITVEEAQEEADFVLRHLENRRIDCPVVFDWETAGASDARTNGLSTRIVCECAIAFCEGIKAAGYTPMIYMNTHDGYVKYDLAQLTDYQIWYAGQYNGAFPCFVYDFQMWQYTSSGELNGINGHVDMDLWFRR